ncbi:MAG: NosD domain-containing protein [Candidatus Bathyarchaeia archaeon]
MRGKFVDKKCKIALITMLAALLLFGLSLMVNVRPVKAWSGTITIREDGTIEPSDAPIITSDYITYILTGNISSSGDGIDVERNNITIDGAGYTIEGIGDGAAGIYLMEIENVTVKNVIVTRFGYGIWLEGAVNCTIIGNTLINNTENGMEIWWGSDHNRIIGNNIVDNNWTGIHIGDSCNNIFYHNNFIGNKEHVGSDGSTNFWSGGNPSEGNYWDDYDGEDSDEDGIGDTPYYIAEENFDNYPLMGPFRSFGTPSGFNVEVISNSTIGNFQYFTSNGTIVLHASESKIGQTYGFCRLTIPHSLMQPPFAIKVNGVAAEHKTIFENETLSIIYFAYHHSTVKITVVPEFQKLMALLPLLALPTVAIVVWRRKRKTS